MKPIPHADCQIEVQFHTTPDGRPQIYDFFWEHIPPLFQWLKEKRVEMTFSLPQKKGTKKEKQMLHHFVQKFLEEKRFKYKAAQNQKKIEVRIPTPELENVLSVYNILFDACLSQTRLCSSKIGIDFSRAGEEKVYIHTNRKMAPRIHAFLKKNLRKPGIRTIVFSNPKALHQSLKKGRINAGERK